MADVSIHLQGRIAATWPRDYRLIDGATALLLAALLALIALFPLHINHDAALFLETGNLILDGKQPYADFAEINLPLVMYLHAIPAAIGRVLAVNPIPVFSLLVLALTLASVWTTRILLAKAYHGEIPLALRLIPAFIALYTLYLYLIADYGQREHLFMLLFLPGLILRWSRWQGDRVDARSALLLGILAGAGASIKPYFLIVAFAPELYWTADALRKGWKAPALRRALFAPEVLGFVGFGALYALLLLVVPALREGIVRQILPYVTSSYRDYAVSVTLLALLWRLDTVLMGIALLASFPLLRRNRPLVRPLWVLTLAAVVIFCWQGKGWYYHRIPAIFGSCLLIAMTLVQRDPYDLPLINPLLKILLVITAYAIITLGGIVLMSETYPGLRRVITQYSRPGAPVMFINSGVTPAYPLLMQTGRRAADRNLSGYAVGPDAASDRDLAAYLDSIRQTIATRRPPIILIDTEIPCYGCTPGYGVWQYLQESGYIERYILPDYRDAGGIEQYEVYLPLPR